MENSGGLRYASLLVWLLALGLIGRVAIAEPLPFAGIWQGTSGGDDRATWTARVDEDGQIRASGNSREAGPFTATGFVTPRGVVTMKAAGRKSTFATFRGAITSDNRVDGTWENRGAGGLFSGRRIDAQPVPGECVQAFGPDRPPPAGFSPPYDPIDEARPLLIRALGCATANALISVGTGAPNQYVYRYAYEWRNDAWLRIDLQGALTNETWIVGNATGVVVRPSIALASLSYVVAYVCTEIGKTWRCGCTDEACNASRWQLQEFRRLQSIP